MDGFRSWRGQRRNVVRLLLIVATVVATVLPPATAASAAGSVNLQTNMFDAVDFPVPGVSNILGISVSNVGTATATHVVTSVPVPAGSTVDHVSPNCTVASGHITCAFGTIGPSDDQGADMWVTFAAIGVHSVTSSAHADQPDSDGNSSDQLNVDVIAENADLQGHSDNERVVLGTSPTYHVAPAFSNGGPTAAAGATLTGSVTGATIVPNSLTFQSDYFGGLTNLAATDCTVAATTFTCAPVFSGGVFYAPQPFVAYDVQLPTTKGTVVASATLTGSGDPDHSNDTSKTTLDVEPPGPDLLAQLTPVNGPVASSQPGPLDAQVINVGELAAANVVATITVPPAWGIALSTSPLPAGVTCIIQTAAHAMRCTGASLAKSDQWDLEAMITPPAGTGTGTVTVATTTTSTQTGADPDSASEDVGFRPGGQTRSIVVDPNANLSDGDPVTVSGTNFTSDGPVDICQGILAPAPARCGTPFVAATADGNGHFQATIDVVRFLVVDGFGVVDCAQPQSSCAFGAYDQDANITAEAAIAFTQQSPVADPFNARITGRVTDGNGNPAAGAAVWAFRSTDTWVGSVRTTTDANGNYDLEDAEPGIAYRIVFGAPPGSGLLPQWYGGPGVASATRQHAIDVTLTATAPVAVANATLQSGGIITGTVVDQHGAPVANTVVWGYRPGDRFVGSYVATTAADGTYQFAGVAPGTPIRLRFIPPAASGLQTEWFGDVPTAAASTPVEVAAGATVNANAALDPLP